MTYSAEVLADSPLGYWRLGEASGTTMLDSSGNGRNGTYVNSPTLGTTGLLTADADTCGTFNGSNQWATVTYGAWMNPSAVTLEAVVNRDTTANMGIMDRDSTGGRTFQFRISGDKLNLIIWTTVTGLVSVTGATTLTPGNIYHLAATYDGTTVSVYVNGSLDGSASATGAMSSGTSQLVVAVLDAQIGAPGTWPFDGKFDEAAYYGTALSSTRIAAHYTALTTGGGGGGATIDLSLAGALPAVQSSLTLSSYTNTTTTNRANGRVRGGRFVDETAESVTPLPAGLTRAARVDKAIAYPTPTLVDGRPT